MKMNLSKRILVALLSCLLVQFTAQAGSYTSASQSGQQPQGPAAGQTPPQSGPQTPSAFLPPVHVQIGDKIKEELLRKLNSPKARLPETANAKSKADVIRFVEGGAARAAALPPPGAERAPGPGGPPAPLVAESIIVRQLTRDNASLRAQQRSLNNPSTIVRDARALGMVRPGEHPYEVTGLPGR